MGINVGGIDLANEIVDLHFQLHRTQILLEVALNKIPNMAAFLPEDIKAADEKALEFVQKKFPQMGVVRK